MIDIVYALGKGSTWNNNEIRYSLRSLEKHVSDFRRVFVIGIKPDFLNENIIHVPYQDIYSNKARNIMSKIHWVCGDHRLTKEFMFLNDDYFFLKPMSALNYPYYYKCDLEQSVKIQFNEYQKYCLETLNVLKANRLNTKNFDVHMPIIYDKHKFRMMCEHYNWHTRYGYIVKSMYCNHYGIKGIERADVKISGKTTVRGIAKLNENRELFSTSDHAMTVSMKSYLMGLFPKKSKYEW